MAGRRRAPGGDRDRRRDRAGDRSVGRHGRGGAGPAVQLLDERESAGLPGAHPQPAGGSRSRVRRHPARDQPRHRAVRPRPDGGRTGGARLRGLDQHLLLRRPRTAAGVAMARRGVRRDGHRPGPVPRRTGAALHGRDARGAGRLRRAVGARRQRPAAGGRGGGLDDRLRQPLPDPRIHADHDGGLGGHAGRTGADPRPLLGCSSSSPGSPVSPARKPSPCRSSPRDSASPRSSWAARSSARSAPSTT